MPNKDDQLRIEGHTVKAESEPKQTNTRFLINRVLVVLESSDRKPGAKIVQVLRALMPPKKRATSG